MECGRQCCALHQITRIERRSKYSCSDCFLCIPFVFSEVQTKLATYMYVTCVCNRTWSLGLRAPLVPCNIFPFPKHRCMIWYEVNVTFHSQNVAFYMTHYVGPFLNSNVSHQSLAFTMYSCKHALQGLKRQKIILTSLLCSMCSSYSSYV